MKFPTGNWFPRWWKVEWSKGVTRVTPIQNSRSSCKPGKRLELWEPRRSEKESHKAVAQISEEGLDAAAASVLFWEHAQRLVLRVPKETGGLNQPLLSDEGQCWSDIESNNKIGKRKSLPPSLQSAFAVPIDRPLQEASWQRRVYRVLAWPLRVVHSRRDLQLRGHASYMAQQKADRALSLSPGW